MRAQAERGRPWRGASGSHRPPPRRGSGSEAKRSDCRKRAKAPQPTRSGSKEHVAAVAAGLAPHTIDKMSELGFQSIHDAATRMSSVASSSQGDRGVDPDSPPWALVAKTPSGEPSREVHDKVKTESKEDVSAMIGSLDDIAACLEAIQERPDLICKRKAHLKGPRTVLATAREVARSLWLALRVLQLHPGPR